MTDHKHLIDNCKSVILQMDEIGTIIYANDYALDFFGFSKHELVGKKAAETIIPRIDSHGRQVEDIISNIVNMPDQMSVNENENIKKNGERVWMLWSNCIVEDNGAGFGKSIISIGNDISHIKKNDEDYLLKSIAADTTDFGIFITDMNKRILEWSSGAEKIFGWSRKEALGKLSRELLFDTEQVSNELYKRITKVYEDGPLWKGELHFQAKNGRQGVREVYLIPLKNRHGKTIGYANINKDITKRKIIEKELYVKSLILQNVDIAVCATDLNLKIVEINDCAESFFSAPKEKIIGLMFADAFHLNDNILLWKPEKIAELFEAQNRIDIETEFISLDNQKGFMNIRALTMHDDETNHIGYIFIVKDITEEKKSIDKIQKLNEFEKLISRISARLINISVDRIDDEITNVLSLLCTFYNCDRSAVIIFQEDAKIVKKVYEWKNDENLLSLKRKGTVNVQEELPLLYQQLAAFQTVSIADTQNVSDELVPLVQSLNNLNTRAIITVPLVNYGKLSGFIGFDSVQEKRIWDESIVTVLRVAGLIIINAVERKESENALRKSQEQLKITLEAFTDGIWDYNVKTGEICVNPGYFTLLGYNINEFKPNYHSFIQMLHPDEKDDVKKEFKLLLKGKIIDRELRMRTKSGDYIWVHLRLKLVESDAKGSPSRIVGTLTDINYKVIAQAALLEKDARIQSIFKAAENIGFIIADIEEKEPVVIEFSPGAEFLLGYTKKEILGESIYRFHPSESKAVLSDSIQSLIRNKSSFKFELPMLAKNGTLFPAIFAVYPILGTDDTVNSCVIIFIDITERIQSEDEKKNLINNLEKANDELISLSRLKDEFIAIASHDLRSPFTSILGFAELLLSESNLTDKHRKYVEIIIRSAKTQLKYVNDLLDLTRHAAGTLQIELKRTNIYQLIDDCINSFSLIAEKKNIEISTQLKCKKTAKIDSSKILQVMNNLIANAIKFTPINGKIIISCDINNNNELEIHVVDNGIGISEDLRQDLFTYYTKAQTAGTEGEKGTGLGLALSKKLIHLHNGTISVNSKSGEGSDFYFKIPLEDKD